MNTKNITFLIVGLLAGVVMATTVTVFADGDPVTDSVPRAIPYQGVLEFNGQPVNTSEGEGILMQFALYNEEGSQTPVYTQNISLNVYAGRFTATIGPVGDDGVLIEDVVKAADELTLGMTLLGEDAEDTSDDVVLTNRQRIMASPYAMWSSSATNLNVASTLQVGGNAFVDGNLNLQGLLQGSGEATRLGGSLSVQGSDFRLGLNDGRAVGERGGQRALAHLDGDVLSLNHNVDFEGGTRVGGDVTFTGNISVQGDVSNAGINLKPKYHVTHTSKGNTVNLDMTRIVSLCGDKDGCSVRLAMNRWNSNVDSASASREFLLYYNASDGRWRSSADTTGRVGDGARTHIREIFDTCYLTDGVYANFRELGDDGAGLKLLVWNGFNGPNRSCELTFLD